VAQEISSRGGDLSMANKRFRPLDEKRIGLLIRMAYHRSTVCPKAIQVPLLRRGFVQHTHNHSYKVTPAGEKAAEAFIKEYTGKPPLKTYGGISIGDMVMIVKGGSGE
jgi:hypothetical protein